MRPPAPAVIAAGTSGPSPGKPNVRTPPGRATSKNRLLALKVPPISILMALTTVRSPPLTVMKSARPIALVGLGRLIEPTIPPELVTSPAKMVPAKLCVTPPPLVVRLTWPSGRAAVPSVASARKMPLPAVIVIKPGPGIDPPCRPCRLVGANAASWPAVIRPAATPEEPLSVIVPAVAVKFMTKPMTVKPRSIARLRPAVRVRNLPDKSRVLAVPNDDATRMSRVASREMSAFWLTSSAGLTQDTVAASGAWLPAIVGRSPGRTT